MSTTQSSSGLQTTNEKDLTQQAQKNQWREIGIASVAAAAQQASTARASTVGTAGAEKRVVTLRDIDHFVA